MQPRLDVIHPGRRRPQLVRSREEVDGLPEKAAAADAIVTRAYDRPWRIYSGYFRDPDGHLWEIIWHPNRAP